MKNDKPEWSSLKIKEAARSQLAIDLNCTPEDLQKDGIIFCESRDNPGRRPFPRDERHFEMLTMGKSIVVSATADLLPYLKEQLTGKFRDDVFAQPFVFGHSMYYLPDIDVMKNISFNMDFEIELIEQPSIVNLYETEGFNNAIQYDPKHPRPDVLVAIAKDKRKTIGIAGASDDCAKMWQIGIDVLSEYRNRGLGAVLTHLLATEILKRGYIPYYGTASSNIPSQRVAHRAGFEIAWMCSYRGRFDDVLTLPTS